VVINYLKDKEQQFSELLARTMQISPPPWSCMPSPPPCKRIDPATAMNQDEIGFIA
jgi:hypothetical protein